MTEAHLSDETLSACVDGAPEDGGHLGRCDRCRERLAALTRARDLVRAPVPPVDAATREAAVAAAVAGASERDAAADGSASAPPAPPDRFPTPAVDRVVPWRRPRPVVVAGAAAAVAALAAAVALPLTQSHPGSQSASSAARSRHSSASTAPVVPGEGSAQPGASASGGSGSARSSDQAAVPSAVPSAGLPTASGESPSPVSEAAGLGIVDAGSVTSVASLAARATMLESGAGASASSATVTTFSRCLPVASSQARPASSLLRLGTATVDGTPVLVYVFVARAGTTATGSPVAVAVTDACTVLGTASL